jgi:D-sedoheptulose 7-phosphate isomerase
MKHSVKEHLERLVERCPELSAHSTSIVDAYQLLIECFTAGHTLFVGGNGGSCSDAEHIVGELQKGFLSKRPIPASDAEKLRAVDAEHGARLASTLQAGVKALSLTAHGGVMTAVTNDMGGEYVMAQALYALASEGDVLMGISTSGNAANVLLACDVARVKGMRVIGLTGREGGALGRVCDVCIKAPASDTFRIQEYHVPIYHTLCAMVEQFLFE